MSTKIYDAFRINIKADIKEIINKMREIAINTIANDAEYLYMAHAVTSVMALEESENNKNAAAALEEIQKNEFGLFTEMWMLDKIKQAETSREKNVLDCSLTAVATFDSDFWYIKFFSNSGFSNKILNKIIEEIKELEDFHYQNQSDPPEEIPEEEYNKRGQKWEELLPDYKPFNIFPFEVTIFDSARLEKLIFECKYNKKELAYKFDKKI